MTVSDDAGREGFAAVRWAYFFFSLSRLSINRGATDLLEGHVASRVVGSAPISAGRHILLVCFTGKYW
jgi:hypothetical protein